MISRGSWMCLGLLALVCCLNTCNAQSITMLNPSSSSYINTFAIAWQISPTNQNVTQVSISLNCNSGYCASFSSAPSYVFITNYTAFTKSFLMNVSYVNPPDANFLSWTGSSLPMPDGTYVARLAYTRNDSLTFNSGTATFSIDTQTLPPTLYEPSSHAVVSRYINVTFRLLEQYSLSGSPITLYVINSTTNTTVSQMSLFIAMSYSFLMDSSNLTSTTPAQSVHNVTIANTLPDGIYHFKLCFLDNVGHSPNCSTNSNVTLRTTTPPFVVTLPATNGSTVYGYQTGIVLQYTFPVAASSATLLLQHSDISYILPLGEPGNTTTLVISPTDTRFISGTETFVFSYLDSLGNPAYTTSIDATIDFASTPPVLENPASGVTLSSNQSIYVSYELDENVSSVFLVFTTYQTTPSPFRANLTLTNVGSHSQSFLWNGTMAGLPVQVTSATFSGSATRLVSNVTYDVALFVSDYLGNPMASATSHQVNYYAPGYQPAPPSSSATPPPEWNMLISSPPTVTAQDGLLALSFILPVAASPGTLTLTATGHETGLSVTLTNINNSTRNEAGSHTWIVNASLLHLVPSVLYAFTITYQDVDLDEASSATLNALYYNTETTTPTPAPTPAPTSSDVSLTDKLGEAPVWVTSILVPGVLVVILASFVLYTSYEKRGWAYRLLS